MHSGRRPTAGSQPRSRRGCWARQGPRGSALAVLDTAHGTSQARKKAPRQGTTGGRGRSWPGRNPRLRPSNYLHRPPPKQKKRVRPGIGRSSPSPVSIGGSVPCHESDLTTCASAPSRPQRCCGRLTTRPPSVSLIDEHPEFPELGLARLPGALEKEERDGPDCSTKYVPLGTYPALKHTF